MKKTIIISIVIVIFLCSYFVNGLELQNLNIKSNEDYFVISSRIIIVDNEGDGNFSTIQEAIDQSLPGDTIKIYSGTYEQCLTVNTNEIIIEGINQELGSGDDEGLPIVDGGYIDDVILITANNVVVRNLIIRNSGQGLFNAGIHIYSDSNTITRCIFYGNVYGIYADFHDNNIITENFITLNSKDGIIILSSSKNTISNNNISDNNLQGIFLFDADKNIIAENEIKFNGNDGIHLSEFCSYNEISYNSISSNGIDGIKIFFNDNNDNIFTRNSISHNGWNGIHFMDGHDNQILFNSIYANHHNGIHFGNSDRNEIIGNTISQSQNQGIEILVNSKNNEIYYNNLIFNNAKDKGQNTWDNEYPLGGNHWTFYNGNDSDEDGIGDTPYYIPGGNNVDNYPIMKSLLPPDVPDKPEGKSFGEPDQIYTYSTSSSDSNNDTIQYGWDWDSDKIVDQWTDFYLPGDMCQASHVWNESGTFVIYVKARDIRGMISEWSNGLIVIIPRNKANIPTIKQLSQQYFNLFPFLKILLHKLIF